MLVMVEYNSIILEYISFGQMKNITHHDLMCLYILQLATTHHLHHLTTGCPFMFHIHPTLLLPPLQHYWQHFHHHCPNYPSYSLTPSTPLPSHHLPHYLPHTHHHHYHQQSVHLHKQLSKSYCFNCLPAVFP